ncbi:MULTISPECIES: siderophore-interacting protein [Neorhizobium]|jgi:NADPH-dependent ferric siderophore reductase|uniref:siderophore-interacting protein n=1 Tax=Neorhizobium TaxID=1525371 RepID=UPI000CF851F8|nr:MULTISPECIES: siderophore-interacting protein [Neorhizobium]
MTMTITTPYRIFDVSLARREILSPNMARLTFTGPQVRHMATLAPDQRIKIFFPKRDGLSPAIPHRPDWYELYKVLPPGERVPMRTYTIRYLRADACEVDIDFVLHGDNGPASRWAAHADLGDPVQISAPNRDHLAGNQGYEWKPPAGVRNVLLIADLTAVPAAIGILEELSELPDPPMTQAFFEVPDAGDRLPLPRWPGLDVHWMVQSEAAAELAPYGALMIDAAAKARLPQGAIGSIAVPELAEIDVDRDSLWERADTSDGSFYGWVAGEADAVRIIRNLLIKDRGVDRTLVNLMGYWRHGRIRD